MANQVSAGQPAGISCHVCLDKDTADANSRMWQVCPVPFEKHYDEHLCKGCVPIVREHMRDNAMNKCFFCRTPFEDFGGMQIDPQEIHKQRYGLTLDEGEKEITLSQPQIQQSEAQPGEFRDLRLS